jgi:hypothetical protein
MAEPDRLGLARVLPARDEQMDPRGPRREGPVRSGAARRKGRRAGSGGGRVAAAPNGQVERCAGFRAPTGPNLPTGGVWRCRPPAALARPQAIREVVGPPAQANHVDAVRPPLQVRLDPCGTRPEQRGRTGRVAAADVGQPNRQRGLIRAPRPLRPRRRHANRAAVMRPGDTRKAGRRDGCVVGR